MKLADGMPCGYKRIATKGDLSMRIYAHENGNQFVVTGSPPDGPEEGPGAHDCDEMGCGQEHVLWRGETEAAAYRFADGRHADKPSAGSGE